MLGGGFLLLVCGEWVGGGVGRLTVGVLNNCYDIIWVVVRIGIVWRHSREKYC